MCLCGASGRKQQMKKRCLLAFGTRPEAIKLAPLVHRMRASNSIEPIVCVTAQHREMLDSVLKLFDIKPDYDLAIMRPDQSLNALLARAISSLDEVLANTKPDYVLVQGDTATALAGGIASFMRQVPVGHVEAGLRTGSLAHPWPEEANRRMISVITKRHYAPTDTSVQNLLREGTDPDAVLKTGNTVIDALLSISGRLDADVALAQSVASQLPKLSPEKRLILVTGHRRESFGQGFEDICTAIEQISSRPDVEIVYPVHLNPNVRGVVHDRLGKLDNVHLIAPVDYASIVMLMKQAQIILTDSGGIQEEAPALGKPVLVMRQTSERMEAVTAGVAKLVSTDPETIVSSTFALLDDEKHYSGMANAVSPFGDGKACQRIVDDLEREMA
jgi:UDP-N-acetylglucosamine 2-epimerase (non-hydrolysing)